MAGQAKQKNKLLVLQQIFEKQTDENHSLTVVEIIELLRRKGIACERKTVYDDIETLIDSGMDIVVRKRGHSNEYYLADRIFQTEELYILADAVASCRFLTKKKSNELISKLQKLTSKYLAPALSREIYIDGRVKAFNESIYYSVNAIHEAIRSNRKITFRLYYYDIDKRKRLRHDGLVYKASPYYLAWEEDKYYLVCYCEKHEKIVRYRVDRMDRVTICDDEKRASLSISEADIAKSQLSVYSMYGGEERKVTIEFDKDLMNVVIDRFGQRLVCKRVSDDRFSITVDVQISPTFWGWFFQWGDRARIVAPDDVAQSAKKELEKILELYK